MYFAPGSAVSGYGASHGAKTATTTKTKTIAAPTQAVGLRRRRAKTSRQNPPGDCARSSSRSSTAVLSTGPPLGAGGSMADVMTPSLSGR